ncbi:MAG: Ku protein [Acidimicrobiales bacterium]|jgi:DNA end-binding protein Ku|nr:Ku protein [Acidimicrobiales bacterium]
MPRSIWSGAISFGLVNVPIKLYSAVSPKDVRFNQLESSTGQRIKQKRVSSVSGEEVPYEEIVKGYEVGPDTYVLIEPSELDALDPKATKSIDIEDFVDLDQIDPIYFERPYYLVPDKGGSKAYTLLLEALKETNKVGIARLVLRTKQYLAAIRPLGDALVLETLLYGDEVVPTEELDELPDVEDVELSERELKIAKQLIDAQTTDFDPSQYRDTYRERVLELIEQKAAGQTIAAAPASEEPTRVVDLMEALEASVAAARKSKASAEKKGA